ncbi:MAG: prolyl oligopeptidase family serine peptidase [Fuerstiella sp.]
MKMTRFLTLVVLLNSCSLWAADRSLSENPNLARYFEAEVAKIERQSSLFNYKSLNEWNLQKSRLQTELFDMLGLSPLPARTPLRADVTGTVEEEEFRVEKLHFQSSPGLYVTASLYLPKVVNEPLPTILYVCGHARMKQGDVSFGNKTGYQHHGAWFARHGYACLTIDTLQLGEIEGIHHGTYRYNRWWWNSRGYTPAGVEAWNCIRALDYLETRPEVDSERIGVTGRSGGGAYSWWIAALDDRIRCAVPVAGITTLRNHVVDGCVEGHCDCMYMVNTSRWDYAKVAALVAPRPLLISNSDKDSIFPLDGVVETHRQVSHIYELYGQPEHLGLQITEGPHKDTQELRIHAFRWFNRWLKNDDSLIENAAHKFFEPEQLRVFTDLPADERNTSIDEDFVAVPETSDAEQIRNILDDAESWHRSSLVTLQRKSFAAWPDEMKVTADFEEVETAPLSLSDDIAAVAPSLMARRIRFRSQEFVPLSLDVILPVPPDADGVDPDKKISQLKSVRLVVVNDRQWQAYARSCLLIFSATTADQKDPAVSEEFRRLLTSLADEQTGVAIFAPRGMGPHAWVGDERKQIQIRRRFQLIGTTADAMRVWDIRRALSLIAIQCPKAGEITVSGRGEAGWLGLTALLTDHRQHPGEFFDLQTSREDLPVFLNLARYFQPRDLLALGLQASTIGLQESDPQLTEFGRTLTGDPRWTGKKLVAE